MQAELYTLHRVAEDFGNFINAVIDRRAFDEIKGYIDFAKTASDAEVIAGGRCDDSVGYFVEPTVIETSNPHFKSMVEEIFGPVLTVYVYDDSTENAFEDVLDLWTPLEYTHGAVFSQDRYALDLASKRPENAAGNFYLNDKPTGAVVGEQPFGGARGSGTNDKAGSYLNLLRWVSPRTIRKPWCLPRTTATPSWVESDLMHKKGALWRLFCYPTGRLSSILFIGTDRNGSHVHALRLPPIAS